MMTKWPKFDQACSYNYLYISSPLIYFAKGKREILHTHTHTNTYTQNQ